MTNSKFSDNGPSTANFPYFYLELNAFAAYSASFNTDKQTEKTYVNVKFQSKIQTHFLIGVVLAVAVVMGL